MQANLNINNIHLLSSENNSFKDPQSHPLISNNTIIPETQDLVEVKVATWNQPYFNLFDYENHNYDMKRFQFDSSANFEMIHDEIEKTEHDQMTPNTMLNIEKRTDGFYITVDPQQKEQYCVIRAISQVNKDQGYILEIGDVIKLGDIKFKISELKTKNPETSQYKTLKCEKFFSEQNHLLKNKIFDVTDQIQKQAKDLSCRYCLVESICEDPIDNLLVHPCDCSGGSGYVHVLCLRSWIQQKITSVNSDRIITYKWNNLKCEVCKKKWPIIIKYKDSCRRLFDIEKPDSAYMLFEQISLNQNVKGKNTMSMILENNNKVLKVGKDIKNHLRLTDPSISSSHVEIQYVGDHFVIKDLKSKFGTIVKLKSDWKIGSRRVVVQVGKTVFTIRTVKK